MTTAKRPVDRKINATDVAELAGVSRSAVSRTFTAGASVSREARERVLAAATTLGYQPPTRNPNSASAGRPSVAVIMANLASPYFAGLCDLLVEELSAKGFSAKFLICRDDKQVDPVFKDALASNVQGVIIFAAVPRPKSMAAAQSAHVPVVILNPSELVEGASVVWIDGPEIGRAVAKLMLGEGRRRPLAIASTPGRSRELKYFAEAMQLGGSDPCRWIDTARGYEEGVLAAAEAFGQGGGYDAVFAASDSIAIGFLDAARNRYGARVPQDISIVGFGNTAPSEWLSHRISTVRLPVASLIQTAVSTLLARLGVSRDPAPRIWLGGDIIERETTLGPGKSSPR